VSDSGAVDALAAGEHLADSFTVQVDDGQGGLATQTVSIDIVGTNDAPVAAADSNSGNEDTIIGGTVATNDNDVDHGAVLSYTLDSSVAGLTMGLDGSYSFDAGNAAYQHLAQGAQQDVIANYTVTDEFGAQSSSVLTIHLTGVNDAPVLTSPNGGNALSLNVAENTSGAIANFNATDVDDGAVLAFTMTGGDDAGDFTIGSVNGQFKFGTAPDFEAPSDANVDNVYLAQVQVSDGLGGIDTQNVTATVTNQLSESLTTGNDTFNGTSANDDISGLAGNDVLNGGWQRYAEWRDGERPDRWRSRLGHADGRHRRQPRQQQ
jgi:VCBS repeat-containing protein